MAQIVIRDFDLLFEGQQFETLISLIRRDLAKNACDDCCRLIFAIKEQHSETYFLNATKCETLISPKRLQLAQKKHRMTFVYFDS